MRETKILTFITIVLIAITLSCIPALAATLTYTKTTLYFYVNANNEVTVTLVNEGSGTVASGSGNQTSNNLNFTCGTANCLWRNVSISGGSAQTDSTPALTITDTGTTLVGINVSVNNSLPAASPADCLRLRYSNETYSSSPTLDLTTTNVTIGNLTAANSFSVWLYGNFSNCQQQTTPLTLYVWAYFW
jgi:hypothetical protein